MEFDSTAEWLTEQSWGTLLLLGGGVLAFIGFQLIQVSGIDPGSLTAYIGGSLLLLGQLAAVVGLSEIAWRFLQRRR